MNYNILKHKIVLLAMLNKDTEALEVENFQPYVLKERSLITEEEFMQCRFSSSPSDSMHFRSEGVFEFFYDKRRIIITALKESKMERCITLLNSVLTNYDIECNFLGCNHQLIIGFTNEIDTQHFNNHYVPLSNWNNILGDEADVANIQMAKHGCKEELLPERIISIKSIGITVYDSDSISGVQIQDIYNYDLCSQFTLADYLQDITSTTIKTQTTITNLFAI